MSKIKKMYIAKITDYAEKMGIPLEGLKQWLKEYKEPPAFGAINIANLFGEPSNQNTNASFKLNTDFIKIEILENYDSIIFPHAKLKYMMTI